MPHLLNLRGCEGVIPEGAVYIGGRLIRGPWRLRKSKWANPFKLGVLRGGYSVEYSARRESVARYEEYLHKTGLINEVHELRGRDLVCWCSPLPCHGDVLLRLANK